MLDPLAAVALAVVAMTAACFVLARIIPDHYDNLELRKIDTRRP